MQFILWIVLALPPLGLAETPCEGAAGTVVTEVRLKGLEATRPHVVRRYLQHRAGEVLDCTHWRREKAALEGLDIFASVTLEVMPSPTGAVLVYRFVELPAFLAFPALKATDQLGWAGGAGISILNLGGEDIRLDAYIRTTVTPDPFAATEYMLFAHSPQMGPLPVEWEVTVSHTDSKNPLVAIDEQSYLADVILRIPLGWGGLQALVLGSVFTLAHDVNRDDFAPDDGQRFPLFLSDGDQDWVPRLGIGLVHDSRETLYNPHFGTYAELSVAQNGGSFGGSADYLEYLGDVRTYLPAFGTDVILLTTLGRYRPGTMGAYDFLHVGGANTLRGYPTLPEYYGRHEVLSTLEYRRAFYEREPFTVWDNALYAGFQWVLGIDAALQWRRPDADPVLLSSLYTGPHLLFPGFDRLRIEFAVTGVHDTVDAWTYGMTIGLFEKAQMQRFRVR